MWIDADAHFYIDSKNIIDLINENNNCNFIFSQDVSESIQAGSIINTGCFIVKNTQYSIDFLTKWGYDETLYNNNSYPCWWDQGVLLDMWKANVLDIQTNSVILDYGVIQHFNQHELLQFANKPFIFHLAGRSFEIRYRISLYYYKTFVYKIDIPK
jgi:Nucleotide-diphospho-sugar transferase